MRPRLADKLLERCNILRQKHMRLGLPGKVKLAPHIVDANQAGIPGLPIPLPPAIAQVTMNPPALRKTSGLAITSLVLGLLGLCCPIYLPSVAAVVCGHIARGKIKKSGGTLDGGGLALAGLILGYITIVIAILLSISWMMFAPKLETYVGLGVNIANAQKIHQAVEKMVADGAAKGDKSLGWPADAGITTVTELKKRLVDNGYLTEDEAGDLQFENFQFGNLSESDPANTVFIRFRPEVFSDATVFFRKDGQQQVIPATGEITIEDPPHNPPYLEP